MIRWLDCSVNWFNDLPRIYLHRKRLLHIALNWQIKKLASVVSIGYLVNSVSLFINNNKDRVFNKDRVSYMDPLIKSTFFYIKTYFARCNF